MNEITLRKKLIDQGFSFIVYNDTEYLEDGNVMDYYSIFKTSPEGYYPDYAIHLLHGDGDGILRDILLGSARFFECELPPLHINSVGKLIELESNCKPLNIEIL